MSQRLIKAYKAFTAKEWPAPPPSLPGAGTPFLASLADANLTILIRALLDAQSRPDPAPALPPPAPESPEAPDAFSAPEVPEAVDYGVSAGPAAFALMRERLEAVREDGAAKFLEFRERWRKRLAFVQLHPFLQRNQWFVKSEEGWAVAGKGTRKDAKMLYLQSLHDMASDGERQVSFLSGHLFRHESDAAAVWHRESVRNNRSRLLPALESSLRNGESLVFKRLRLSLGDLAQEAFMDRVGKWDKRFYASEEELFREAAWPWLAAGRKSGFEGFMEGFADVCEALCAEMINHYEAKWGLYLRGLAPGAKN